MKSKIMVVDDEMHIRELVRFYLDKAGFDTIEAANAEEALDIVENQYIDLAVVDIMMPGMDGFELVESMKEFKDVPCIMLTAKGESKDKLRGFSSGVDDYVVKPFDPNELMARVKAIMKRYYESYLFEKYDISKLDQIVQDKILELYEQVCNDFTQPENYTILKELTDNLSKERVLYKTFKKLISLSFIFLFLLFNQ